MPNVIDILQERGFIEALTSPEIRDMAEKPLRVYCGFDPTADSLHVGNMVGIMALAWFQRCGHIPVALVGGATGMIGDPSGKSVERQLQTREQVELHSKKIKEILERLLRHGSLECLDNFSWISPLGVIPFLRDVGKHFRMGPLLGKESVRKRLDSEEGMSFTEFSYGLLQAYDFLHLFQNQQVVMQLGGSDQWGNITGGVELIRKVVGQTAYGLTFPLLVKSDGQKFGKTEKGAIWLSSEKLSPYEFYQAIFRTADADVGQLLRMLTFLDMEEIRALESSMQRVDYVANSVQKRLAEEVTRIVHGDEGVEMAIKVTEAAAPGKEALLDGATLELLASDMPSCQMAMCDLVGHTIVDILTKAGLVPSKSEARRKLEAGAVYVNNNKIFDGQSLVSQEQLIEGKFLLLAIGKKNKLLIRVI